MEIKKRVKCLKQKVPMITLPKVMYEALNIKTGDILELTLNIKKECIEVRSVKD